MSTNKKWMLAMNPPTDPAEYPDSGDGIAIDSSSAIPVAEGAADTAPGAGMVDEVSSAVAGAIESTNRYLQEQGLKDMAEDLKGLIHRNPIPALLVGVGIGFLIGRAMGPRI